MERRAQGMWQPKHVAAQHGNKRHPQKSWALGVAGAAARGPVIRSKLHAPDV